MVDARMSGGEAERGTRPDEGDATVLLGRWAAGDEEAGRLLWPLVYDELRRVAGAHLRRERPDHTLDSTALVHEAWMRLGAGPSGGTRRREQFLAYVSRAMRSLLVDHARKQKAEKRGGGKARITLREDLDASPSGDIDVLELDDALAELSTADPELGRIAELHLFGGVSQQEVAGLLGTSLRTVERRWRVASTWLRRELGR